MINHSWDTISTETQLKVWRDALIEERGNISRAAKLIFISRSHATRLMKKFELVEFAARLRVEAGMLPASSGERKGVVAGRPRSRIF